MEIRFPLILDGATGTELQKRGYMGDVSAEQWVLEHPESILDIQKSYVEAGSNVLYSPSFGANRRKLEEHGIFNKTDEYNRRLAALSKEAAGGKAWVAGDISPTGMFLSPLGEASFEELVDIYTEQAAGLEEAGVDLFVIETMMTLSDARAAMSGTRANSRRRLRCTSICSGPAEQLRPKALMPMPCKTVSAAVTSVPDRLRPLSSQVNVTKMGLSLTLRTASTAARASESVIIVSITKRSTPASSRPAACSV